MAGAIDNTVINISICTEVLVCCVGEFPKSNVNPAAPAVLGFANIPNPNTIAKGIPLVKSFVKRLEGDTIFQPP